jgi:hypothetical protein
MKAASTPGRIFLRIESEFITKIVRAVAAKMKQTAVIIFIGTHCGIILLRRVMLNSQPVRSRKAKTNTTRMDIHTIICNVRGKSNEYQPGLGICSEELPCIAICNYFKSIYYSTKKIIEI